MTVRSSTSTFLIGEAAHGLNKKILDEYKSICEVSQPIQLQLQGEKQLTEQVIYRELRLMTDEVSAFSDYFTEWKKGSVQRT
jgi:hypothetical protein